MPELELRTQFEAALSAEVYGAAWRYAWRLAAAGRGGCREEAEDLLQEALAHAWRQFGQLRERSQFKAWLLSIVRTRFLTRLRIQRRRPSVAGDLPEQLTAPAPDEAGAGITAALALLPAGERGLLTLFYCEGLSLAETGMALGLSARVVRQRLYRARQALRRAWDSLRGPEREQPETQGRTSDTLLSERRGVSEEPRSQAKPGAQGRRVAPRRTLL